MRRATLQVDECVGAFLLELPKELMDAVDDLHEQFREPILYHHNNQTCVEAKWLAQ